jgi:hypothetical protein
MEGKRATYSREDFLAVFKEVHQELIEELPREFEMPPDAVNWVDKVRPPSHGSHLFCSAPRFQ